MFINDFKNTVLIRLNLISVTFKESIPTALNSPQVFSFSLMNPKKKARKKKEEEGGSKESKESSDSEGNLDDDIPEDQKYQAFRLKIEHEGTFERAKDAQLARGWVYPGGEHGGY